MKYYAGIDGGGTKTKLIIINEEKNIVFQAEAGPTSLDTVSLEVIGETIQKLFANFDKSYKLDAVFAGLGGVASLQDRQKIMQVLKRIPQIQSRTLYGCDNDVNNALVGSLGHDQGMVLISGTGSAVFGHHRGQTWRTGGISAKEGDPGSAYDLGFHALRHLGKVLDGRCSQTVFSQDLMTTLKIHNYEALASFFNHSDRTLIASIAPIVTRHEQDPFAQEIVTGAIKELMLMVKTVYERLEFRKVELGLVGSLANAETYFKRSLIESLNRDLPNMTIVSPPRFEPGFGSALLAMQLKSHVS
jgi:N-acetylglucosamine kinase-like BadF-type ATPase